MVYDNGIEPANVSRGEVGLSVVLYRQVAAVGVSQKHQAHHG